MNMLLWSTDVTGDEYLPIFEMLKDAGYEGVEVPIFELDPEPYDVPFGLHDKGFLHLQTTF